MKVQEPGKELRFTRAGQATGFWLAAAVLFTAALMIVLCAIYRDVNPRLPHPAWALIPLGLAAWCARVAMRLTKHAYLILTPLGIEIFPFFKPAQGMQMVAWQEVVAVDADEAMTRLTLHHDAGKTSGIHLTLRPLRRDRRALLIRAVQGRVDARAE